jgi:8-oxo-dGTP pyrophosphatase MutT (NUDIX family)|uniref:8-oxo-dGTP diphosphatase n=1 Tax=viral metagenome TaxID=1070528 RepID=A0A6C0J483_9ZZZZ|tara:strand:- start:938 stop:1303 length:366 start_codon:yes stop_codon:yes gene_type:complete
MEVACGVMYDNTGNILMGLRCEQGPNPNYWEFPGGQQEDNETLEECLHREWKEELNLKIKIDKKITTTSYNDIHCHFFVGKIIDMENLHINVHQYIGFYNKNQIYKMRLFEGDKEVLDLLE